jgi:hypothetical protein
MAPDADSLLSKDLGETTAEAAQPASIITRATFNASPAKTWQSLLFYEEVKERPPLHLRLLLPVPIRTDGDKKRVGGEAICLYEGGHLLKRTTRIEEGVLYEFEVAEQALAVGGTMRLSGGRYMLREVAPGKTEVSVETRYTSTRRPRWFWRPLERFVCHMFHRFLLRSMQRKAELS